MPITSRTFEQQWLKRRQKTIFCFALLFLGFGIETTMVLATLWSYLTTLMKVEHRYMWYGVISAAYYVPCIPLTIILGRIVDRYNNIRRVTLICLNFAILGNILYCFHYSPYIPLFGRILSGFTSPLKTCIEGGISFPFFKFKYKEAKRINLLQSPI